MPILCLRSWMGEEINVANRALTAMGTDVPWFTTASQARRAPGYGVFTELSHFCNICFS